MAVPLTQQTMNIVKATAPALRQHGVAITTRMYERLFENADVKAMFDQEEQRTGRQPNRLAAAILAYAENIDKLDALSGAVDKMAQRHVETGVHPEHYPYVADALLPAIKDILGDAVTDEAIEAWGKAYWFLADILIDAEKTKYAEQA
jgi:hemoglobin-like flavoprotein